MRNIFLVGGGGKDAFKSFRRISKAKGVKGVRATELVMRVLLHFQK